MRLPGTPKLRLLVGLLVIIILAVLVYAESIESSVGLVMIAAILGALGLYEANEYRKG